MMPDTDRLEQLERRLAAQEQTLNKVQEALRIASKYENEDTRRLVEGIQAALDRAATAAPRKERGRPNRR